MKQATAITQKSEIQCDDDYSREYPSERYEELLKEYELMHDTSDQMFNGRSVASFVDVIQHVLKENNCKTLLDYGSGKGLLYTKDYDKVQIDNPTSKPLPELWDINILYMIQVIQNITSCPLVSLILLSALMYWNMYQKKTLVG